ncbi:MAG: minor capsid protein [Catonella sp.]
MKSREYWKERYMLIENLNNTQGINVRADIDKAFRMAENGIQSEIEKWYSRIADNNGVSISKARQLLTNRELEEFKWDLADYIKHGEENNLNDKWIKELENASGRWHINRLEALKLRVQQKAEEAFGNEVDSIDNFARDAYMRGYYRTAYEIQKGLGLGWNVGVLDDSAIDEILKKPWCPDGKNFSSRIWTRKSQMVDELHREILRTTLLGEHPTKAIDRMLKYVDGSISNARHAAGRLAMTEAAYFGSKGQQDSFNMLGVEEYEIVATLDNSTSKICREMDGQHFPMSEFKPGITAPPFHPYCRTCTCPYFNDEFTEKDIRTARNEEGEVYHIPADMKYEEWKKKYVKNLKGTKKDDKVEPVMKDITDEWKKVSHGNVKKVKDLTEYEVNGTVYKVDGRHVVLDYSQYEKEVADILANKYGREVNMIPRISYPQGISTADYLINGVRYDLKTIKTAGKNVLNNAIQKKKRQSSNFIFDISECPLIEEDIISQIERIYKSFNTRFVDEIVLLKKEDIVKVYKR